MVAQGWFGSLDLAYKYGYRISKDVKEERVADLNTNAASYSAHCFLSFSSQASSKFCTTGGGKAYQPHDHWKLY